MSENDFLKYINETKPGMYEGWINKFECPVCLEEMTSYKSVECPNGHKSCCKNCLKTLKRLNIKKCPVCRQENSIPEDEYHKKINRLNLFLNEFGIVYDSIEENPPPRQIVRSFFPYDSTIIVLRSIYDQTIKYKFHYVSSSRFRHTFECVNLNHIIEHKNVFDTERKIRINIQPHLIPKILLSKDQNWYNDVYNITDIRFRVDIQLRDVNNRKIKLSLQTDTFIDIY